MSLSNKKQKSDKDSDLVKPTIKQSIQDLISLIDFSKDITNLKPQIVTVLNDSLITISHYELQTKLNKIDTGIDDRKDVENKLIRKELEILKMKLAQLNSDKLLENKQFKNDRRRESSESTSLKLSPKSKSGKTRNNSIIWKSTTFSPVSSASTTSPSRKRSLMTLLQGSDYNLGESGLKHYGKDPPMGVLERGRSSDGEDADYLLQTPTTSPPHLKLVENSKPHPRMRRTSDNPSTNEYVRVFHLQKEK
ncbi:hypothetical protein MOSE0_I03950 [Monosporozyma servazzii]